MLGEILGLLLLILIAIFFLFIGLVVAIVVLVVLFVGGLWWLWLLLTIVFVFFRNKRIGKWIFDRAWRLLIVAVILNAIGFIVLLAVPEWRHPDQIKDKVQQRIEREIDDTASLTCKKAGSLVFDKDTTGLELDNYTYIQWNDDGTWRYAVLSPGTWVFEQKIYAGKATGYVGNDCNTAVVKQIVGDRHWASKSTIESFFEER